MADQLSWSEARDEMRKYRENNTRASERVLELWEDVICDSQHRLGDEIWVVLEQVCVAAIDCAQSGIFQDCIRDLDTQFPDSHRVKRLKGMHLESIGKNRDAQHLYDEILKEDPTNSLVSKRKIAILRSENKMADAINQLGIYLKTYMNDMEAWQELCDLYLKVQDYAKAAHTMEELVITHPHHHLYQQRYAEVLYTMGGLDNIETARSYYANAVKLSNQTNMRALYGLMICANTLAANSKISPKAKQDNIRYANWAKEKIASKHRAALSSQVKTEKALLDTVDLMLEAMQISGPPQQMG